MYKTNAIITNTDNPVNAIAYPQYLISIPKTTAPNPYAKSAVEKIVALATPRLFSGQTMYMDLWNNEIISHALSSKRGDKMTYINGLTDLIALKNKMNACETILHSDQGSVYSSKKFNDLLPAYGIVHSMSRAGTPTDNAAMEAINGWIKAELFEDLHVTGENNIEKEISDYISFFNEQRPAYSLKYLTPRQYKEYYFQTINVS